MYSHPPSPSDPPPPARSRKRSARTSAQTEHTLARARRLRAEMTVPERVLWKRLRGNRLGLKFRRQHPIGVYVVDFYCDAAKLVVEIDGAYHADRVEQDRARDAWLRMQGVEVVRIPVGRLMRNIDGTVAWIEREVKKRLGP